MSSEAEVDHRLLNSLLLQVEGMQRQLKEIQAVINNLNRNGLIKAEATAP